MPLSATFIDLRRPLIEDRTLDGRPVRGIGMCGAIDLHINHQHVAKIMEARRALGMDAHRGRYRP